MAFLYRDDYYDPETEKKNIAEVIIAKQRNGPTGHSGACMASQVYSSLLVLKNIDKAKLADVGPIIRKIK